MKRLRDLAKHHCTIALFLSATLTKKVVKEFLDAGWSKDTPVAVVYKASWPDQKIVRTTLEHLDEDMKVNGIRKQAMILAGWALDENIHDKNYRSKLYDKSIYARIPPGGGFLMIELQKSKRQSSSRRVTMRLLPLPSMESTLPESWAILFKMPMCII